VQRGFFEYDPMLGWKGKPGAKGIFAGRSFYSRVTHNERGHRSSVPPFVAGKRNVLLLGDSFGWGYGVEDDEIPSEQMMRMRPELNMYNLSAPGYGTGQEYLALKTFLEERPGLVFDDVVLQMCWNDFWDVAETALNNYPKPMFVLRDGELELTNVPVPPLKKHSMPKPRRSPRRTESKFWHRFHLFNLIESRVQGFARFKFRDSPPTAEDRERVALVLRLLDEMADLCRSRGARFHVVLVLFDDEDNWRWLLVRRHLAGRNIPVVDFKAYGYWRQTLLWLDNHLNAHGNRRLAERLVAALDATAGDRGSDGATAGIR
ncbi:MAG: SGNH/GDSL hydrolase family protein, partial [Verrucomicrobia bacterium]|nr:SGNH/GDSL hydrolase family protein [Verrucomicrobiota bacterium]